MGADWWMLGLIHGIVGYEALVLGFIASGGDTAAEAMLIIAFLCYTTAVIVMCLSKYGEVSGMAVDISTIVLVMVAGLFGIIGASIWASKDKRGTDAYRLCLDLIGSLLALLSGVFFILKIVGVQEATLPDTGGGSSKGGKGKGGKAKGGKSNQTVPV